MTIEDIFFKDEISILARNICMANNIKTIRDLKLQYDKSGGFMNLLYCDEKSNDELIAVYKRYKNIDTENSTTMAGTADKDEQKLENVVTDFNEVVREVLASDTYLKNIEQQLKEHWKGKGGEETQQNDSADFFEKTPSETTPAVDIETIEQRIEKYWSEKREREAAQHDGVAPAGETTSATTDVIDLNEIEQAIEAYKRKQEYKKNIQSDTVKHFVRSTSVQADATLLQKLELRLKKHWIDTTIDEAEGDDAERKWTFGRHPSEKLNELYATRGYQGANPEDAKLIFVGRDPNWAVDIEEMDIFGFVVEYLTDGVAFWEKYGIHHPFLLKNYKGDGQRYHRRISKLNLDRSAASKISFVELIGFPTMGMAGLNSALYKQYLFSKANRDNLILLDRVLNDTNKIVFIAWGLTDSFKEVYKKTGLLKRFAEIDKRGMDKMQLNRFDNIYIQMHFSDAIRPDALAEIEEEIKKYL